MIKRLVTGICLLLPLSAGFASAKDISFGAGLLQGDFKDLSKEAAGAMTYKNLAPAAPLGLTGFDIGVEATAVDIKSNSEYWKAAFNGDAPSLLVIPRVRARKGLFWGIDVGAMYAYVPSSNVKLFGAEISKAILSGGAVTPALGVRATYTKLTGVNDLGFQTAGIDASVSKGIAFITPYLGGGVNWVDSEPKGNLQTLSGGLLKEEKFWQPRVFGGVEIKPFPFLRLVGEAEYNYRPNYSLKLAVGF